MDFRVYGVPVRSRGGAVALAVGAVVIGGVLLALGLALVAGLAVTATLVGLAVAVARRVTGGRRAAPPPRPLDRSLEVFPERSRSPLPSGEPPVR
jgi:hypothetical protein